MGCGGTIPCLGVITQLCVCPGVEKLVSRELAGLSLVHSLKELSSIGLLTGIAQSVTTTQTTYSYGTYLSLRWVVQLHKRQTQQDIGKAV